jgi:hypothetical protein
MRFRFFIGLMIGIIIIGLVLFARTTPPGYTLIELTEETSGKQALSAVLTDGEEVILTWRNSQFGLDVTEGFHARGGLLIQDRVTFAAPDGTPPPRVSAQDVTDLYHTGGAFDAQGLSRPFSRIVYRIGEIGDPKLRVQDRIVALKQTVGFGGRMVLTAVQPTYREIIFHW